MTVPSRQPGTSRHPGLHAGFAAPAPEFSPTPIWWWSGAEVTLPRLCEQLDRLVEQGVYNAVVLNLAPTGPVYGALADRPALLSEQWWELWDGLCAHAGQRGARLWFYDQIGFSGANLQGILVNEHPEFAAASLESVTSTVDTPGTVLRCPPEGTPIAGYAIVDGEAPHPLPVRDGGISWDGPAPHRLRLVYSLRRGFDYTSPAACAALRELVHGEFERRLGRYFGDVIAGSFQDELPSMPGWGPAFAEEFAKRCGYRIEPVIAALWEDWGVESARVRLDYQRTRAALAEESFFEPLHAWHERHGLTVGFDQQSPSRAGEPIGCTRQYADYQRTHRWFSAPGSDHWGDAKIHSSLAHHYGRPRTWIEAFHSTGWGGTLEETFDWLQPWLLAGATLYNPHAVYYDTRDGWWEWAPPSTCWRQPYWPHYRHFADTVSRLCWLLTRGEHVCEVGVLFPATTVAAHTLTEDVLPEARDAQREYLALTGRTAWFNSRPSAIGRDFDVLDDDTVFRARATDGALHTRGERYRAVLLPSCRMLETGTARRLVEFARCGGLLLFAGEPPEHADTPDGDEVVRALRALGSTVPAGEPAEALRPLESGVHTDGPSLHRMSGDSHLLLLTASPDGSATAQPMLPWAQWSDEVEDLDMPLYNREMREHGYDFDPRRNRPAATVRLDGPVRDVEQWDPLTGTARPLPAAEANGRSEVTVDFTAAPATVLVWRDGEPEHRPPSPERPQWTYTELPGPWRAEILDAVRQWRVAHRRGTGSWQHILVGYGTFGWHTAPADPSTLPAPLPPGHPGPLHDESWHPVRYSLSRGVERDPLHIGSLGPKGRVPDEFWHIDEAQPGQAVQLRTTLPTGSARELTLAIGGNGRIEVWWNGQPLPEDPGGYLRLDRVHTIAGPNLLELRVHAESAGALRGYWALTEEPAEFVRPEWITPADGARPGTRLVARSTITVPERPVEAIVQLGTEGAATFLVNGTEIATQGAFDPYATRANPRVLPYDITERLHPGENTLEVIFTDRGSAVAMLVDGLLRWADGSTRTLLTGTGWELHRDGTPVPTALRRDQPFDPRWALLRPRPHPLPRSGWLDRTQPSGTLDVIPDARLPRGSGDAEDSEGSDDEWFRLAVPPGAHRMRLPIAGQVTAWLDGAELTGNGHTGDGHTGTELTGDELPDPDAEHRELTVRVRREDGRTGGALWDGPAEFDCGPGTISPGPWREAGLGSYSGGVRYHRELTVPDPGTRMLLDLGAVRGTAEVHVNGESAGVRVWSPYRFELTGLLRDGVNRLSVTVFNTLGPSQEDSSPTTGVYAGQCLSGLLGPVTLGRLP